MTLYQPPHFVVGERAALLALMRAYPLATLLSAADGVTEVTHLPLEVEDHRATEIRLLGHVARANPHWKAWEEQPSPGRPGKEAGRPGEEQAPSVQGRTGQRATVTAIFHGPDGYVSPRWYSAREAVPTWNYVVVHARGRITATHDSESKERILKALIDRHDPDYRRQWDELGDEYRERMKRGIVGLTIEVERLEGKFKLSQNRPSEDRDRVFAEMRSGAAAAARDLAGWMARLGIAGPD